MGGGRERDEGREKEKRREQIERGRVEMVRSGVRR